MSPSYQSGNVGKTLLQSGVPDPTPKASFASTPSSTEHNARPATELSSAHVSSGTQWSEQGPWGRKTSPACEKGSRPVCLELCWLEEDPGGGGGGGE